MKDCGGQQKDDEKEKQNRFVFFRMKNQKMILTTGLKFVHHAPPKKVKIQLFYAAVGGV